jgi:hypothetical protein
MRTKNSHRPALKKFLIGFLKVIGGVVSFFVVLGLVINFAAQVASPTSDTKTFEWNDALTMCQLTIKGLARDPETADVPYVSNLGKGNEFYFSWGHSTKFARMKNGLGLDVPVSASCIVDRERQKITSLTVDGKTIIGH